MTNPTTTCSDIMVYSLKQVLTHPYWYACIFGIFHAHVLHVSAKSINHTLQDIEFLWVCWFSQVPGHHFSMKAAQLPKVGFVPGEDNQAFGFLDLSLVVWGYHLIPSFSKGQTNELQSATLTAAWLPGDVLDWLAYYINM